MRKIIIFSIYTLIVIFLMSGCSHESEKLYVTGYPENISCEESFKIRGEYLTKNPQEYNEIDILLSIIEFESRQTVFNDRIKLTENKSQQFVFENIILEEIERAVYFELKLVGDGEYITSVDTKDKASFLADWKKNIITTYFDGAGEKTPGGNL